MFKNFFNILLFANLVSINFACLADHATLNMEPHNNSTDELRKAMEEARKKLELELQKPLRIDIEESFKKAMSKMSLHMLSPEVLNCITKVYSPFEPKRKYSEETEETVFAILDKSERYFLEDVVLDEHKNERGPYGHIIYDRKIDKRACEDVCKFFKRNDKMFCDLITFLASIKITSGCCYGVRPRGYEREYCYYEILNEYNQTISIVKNLFRVLAQSSQSEKIADFIISNNSSIPSLDVLDDLLKFFNKKQDFYSFLCKSKELFEYSKLNFLDFLKKEQESIWKGQDSNVFFSIEKNLQKEYWELLVCLFSSKETFETINLEDKISLDFIINEEESLEQYEVYKSPTKLEKITISKLIEDDVLYTLFTKICKQSINTKSEVIKEIEKILNEMDYWDRLQASNSLIEYAPSIMEDFYFLVLGKTNLPKELTYNIISYLI